MPGRLCPGAYRKHIETRGKTGNVASSGLCMVVAHLHCADSPSQKALPQSISFHTWPSWRRHSMEGFRRWNITQ